MLRVKLQSCWPVLQVNLIESSEVGVAPPLKSCALVSNPSVCSLILLWQPCSMTDSDSAFGDHQQRTQMLVPAFHQHPQDSGHLCPLLVLCRERSHSQLLCPSVYSQFITSDSPGGLRDHQHRAQMGGPPRSWIKPCLMAEGSVTFQVCCAASLPE